MIAIGAKTDLLMSQTVCIIVSSFNDTCCESCIAVLLLFYFKIQQKREDLRIIVASATLNAEVWTENSRGSFWQDL